jgi:hypothetical protein
MSIIFALTHTHLTLAYDCSRATGGQLMLISRLVGKLQLPIVAIEIDQPQ